MCRSHIPFVLTYFIFQAKLENIESFLNIFITEVMNGNAKEIFYFIFYLFMNIIYLYNYSARRGRVRL